MAKNILFITADQWRGDCLSAAGHPHVRTPSLDALAADGVRFTSHFASTAPCAPARASLYTGLYQMNHRVVANGTPLDARHDTIALAARRAGYQPVLFGHTDSAVDPRYCQSDDPRLSTYEGVLPGFDAVLAMKEDEREWREWLAGRGIDLPADHPHRAPDGVDDPPRGRAPVYNRENTATAFMVDRTIAWLDGRRAGECHADDNTRRDAWFIHLSLLRPHPPFAVPEPFASQVDPAAIDSLAGGGNWHAASRQHPYTDHAGTMQDKGTFIDGASGPVRDWTPSDLQQIAATYFGSVNEIDAQLGRLFEHLKRIGAWDDTIIIVTSDHGEMLGDHGLLGKGGFHDGSYHIPLIIRDPSRPDGSGRVVEAMTEAVDIMPTLLDLIGEPSSSSLDGQSLTPWSNGETPAWRDAVHWEFDFRDVLDRLPEAHFDIESTSCNLAVHRTRTHKYVHFAGLPPLLFDLVADPDECHDLIHAGNAAHHRVNCAEALLSWRAAHLDQTLARLLLMSSGSIDSDISSD